MVGNGILNLVKRALPEELRTDEYVATARHDFLEYYTVNIDRYTRPYEGIREVLHTLQAEGWNLAVASNKFDEGTQKLVHAIFPEVAFKAIYGNKDGFPLKPDAALVQLIMNECDATAETTIMIGDSGVDIQTAKNSGIRSIGCAWGFRPRIELEEYGADYIVDTPSEILRVLG